MQIKIFFIKNTKIIFIIEFKKYIAGICIFNIMINKFNYKKNCAKLFYLKLIKA